ncbi:MAG TPA: chemotaxis protein CheB [Gaiellaceae bacterium]
MTRDLVVVGASWGGLDAIRTVLHGLPDDLPAAVVIVQHRSPVAHPQTLLGLLAAATPLAVVDPADKQKLERGQVYVSPPDYHTYVEGDHLALSTDDPVAFSRPSIDVLFESAAESRGPACVGVILTGANADGARGLARIVELGGAAVVEDPASAERSEMPRAALQAVHGALVAPIGGIAAIVGNLCARAGVTA